MEAAQSTEISTEELSRLPPHAMSALAVRAAWRVLPFSSQELPADRRSIGLAVLVMVQRMACGLKFDDLVLLSLEPRQYPPFDELIQLLWDVALVPQDSLQRLAELLQLADARLVDFTLERIKVDPATLRRSNDSQGASRADLASLVDWAGQPRATDGLVPLDFFSRPLWKRSDGDEPPFLLGDAMEAWMPAQLEAGLSLLPEYYEAMLHGRADRRMVEELGSFVEGWWEEYQSVLKGQQSDGEQDVAPPDEADATSEVSPSLPAGIVYAAADKPSEVDHLGRAPLVQTLADMLSYPGQALPMTIALLGDWGSGKSTVLYQLKVALESIRDSERELDRKGRAEDRKPRARYLFAEFNAWEYEQTDSMRAGLAQEVVKGLTRGMGWWRKFGLALRRASKAHFLEFWQTVGALVLALIGVWLGISLVSPDDLQKAIEGTQLAKELGGTGIVGASFYVLSNVWRSARRLLEHPMASQMNTYLKLPNYGKHLGDVPVIKHELESLCEMRLEDVPNGRLLVIVDDLDRCRPEAITETFDAIRLVMNMKNVAVIVAIDDRIAFRAVADHYRKLAEGSPRSADEIARDYLSKIIQLPVNLYEPWHWEVRQFVHKSLFPKAKESPGEEQQGSGELPQGGDIPEITAAARRLAQSNDIDIHQVRGTGKDGKIVFNDVRAYLAAEDSMVEDTAIEQQQNGDVRPHDFVELEQELTEVSQGVQPESASAAQRQAERVYELMQDMAFERKLFADLARDLYFHNPRQLIRLKNSYSLIKGYRHNRALRSTPDRRLGERLMHGLFWYEYLYQCDLEHRRRNELVVWFWPQEEGMRARAEEADSESLPPAVRMARRFEGLHGLPHFHDEYIEIMETVEMAVLPNAEMGLVTDLNEAMQVRGRDASGGLLPLEVFAQVSG